MLGSDPLIFRAPQRPVIPKLSVHLFYFWSYLWSTNQRFEKGFNSNPTQADKFLRPILSHPATFL